MSCANLNHSILTALQAAQTVTAAIEAFQPPSTHEIMQKPVRARPDVWKYGVKLKNKRSGKVSFACFGDEECRKKVGKGTFIGLSKDAMSNALVHVQFKHEASKYSSASEEGSLTTSEEQAEDEEG